ncbi:MAG: aminoacyl-histidine dipeptidase [Clostridium sp.]|nr:aminoacyl-histidine dipeptidase [Clostridium sp.]
MGVLSRLEPMEVFHFFEEICGIPHGSGNVGRLSDYLAQFAGNRNLSVTQDAWKNIMIIKEATSGYENEPAVILQGHIDMVAVKKPGLRFDLENEGLRLAVAGDKVYAEGTSLGGDDGIAVAYALALLDSDRYRHPRLEVVLTADEEVGMDGARAIDLSALQGKRLLNLDSEEEGVFLASCAGGARVDCFLPLAFSRKEGLLYEVAVTGLLGGHSGMEIHKGRGNANCLLGRLLWELTRTCGIGIRTGTGGLADNAIPREAIVTLVIKEEEQELFLRIVKRTESEVKEELGKREPEVAVSVKPLGNGKEEVRCAADGQAAKCAAFLVSLPDGVQAMSKETADLVETSLNLGMFWLEEGGLRVRFAVRSSVESRKRALIARLEALGWTAGAKLEVTGDYPGWKYREDSPWRRKMLRVYEAMYGKPPKVEGIHAGLECGLFFGKIQGLDCVSIGPDMENVHTTEEALRISSVKRVWEFLIRLLEEKEEAAPNPEVKPCRMGK